MQPTLAHVPATPAATAEVRTWLNLLEAADYLRVSDRLIEKLVSQRRLKPARINRRLIFKRTELDRYAELQMARCA